MNTEPIVKLAKLRARYDRATRRRSGLAIALDETPEAQAYEGARAEEISLREQVRSLEAAIKTEAVSEYAQTGDKKPADGVQIKLFKKVVYDIKLVTSWCRRNAHTYLILDKRHFERAAKLLPDMPAEVIEEPRVQIARDLSAYLETEETE